MTTFWVVFLALIQGLTEFLPVSSSAHLVIFGAISGMREEDELAFFIVLHLGTLLAMATYFWRDIWALFASSLSGDRAAWRYVALICTATIPTAIIGFTLKKWIESAISNPAMAGGTLFITASFLWATKYLPAGKRGRGEIKVRDALLLGTAQGISASFRGISRSGATISTAMALGLTREEAFRFSFLASLPAVAGATLLEVREIGATAGHLGHWVLWLGAWISFSVGLASLALLKRTVVGNKFHWYSVWCVLTGIGGLVVGFMKG